MSSEDFERLVPKNPINQKTKVSSLFIIDEKLRWAREGKPKTWKNVVVRISINTVIHLVHVEPCFSVMSEEVKELFISYLAERGRLEKLNLRMNNDMSQFYTLVGAIPGMITIAERDDLMIDDKRFCEGWLYYHREF